VCSRYLALPGVRDLLPRNTELVWDAGPGSGRRAALPLALLRRANAFLTGERLEDAQAGRDPQFNQTMVTFQLDRRGGRTSSG
jgi:preprotein translocase subunit SecD